jgi:hypothetical protein
MNWKKMHNNSFQRTTISVIFFAKAKKPPLITAADAGIIRTLPLSLQGPDNAALTGNLSNILLSGLFRSATEPDNKTFDRQFGTDNSRCRGHYQCQTARQRRVIAFCEGNKRKINSLRKELKLITVKLIRLEKSKFDAVNIIL